VKVPVLLYDLLVSVWIYTDTPLYNRSRWWAFATFILPLLVPYYVVKTRPYRYWKLIGLWLLGFFIAYIIGTAMVKFRTINVPTSSNQPSQWKTFVSSDKSFTVEFPTEPSRGCDIVNTPNGKVKLIEYMSKSKGILYAVMYGDYPGSALSGLTSEQMLDNARNGAIENVQGKLLSEISISKNGYPGREITVKAEPNMVLTAQIILKDNRFYQLVVITPSDKLFTSQRKEFFDSFKILR